MSAPWWQVALALAAPLWLGVVVVAWCGVRRRDEPVAYPAWVYLTGTLALAAMLFAWIGAGLPIERFLFAPYVVAAGGTAWTWRRAASAPDDRPVTAGRFERAVFVVVVAATIAVAADHIVGANQTFITIGDEANIWTAKAKVLWVSGGFNDRFVELTRPGEYLVHPDYPLFNPLIHLWTYIVAGGMVDGGNRLPIQLFAVALLLLVAASARRVARPAVAAVLVLLYGLSGLAREACLYAVADVMVACGFLGAIDAWSRFRSSGDRRWLRLFAMLLAGLAWSKNEGIMLALAVVVPVLLSLVAWRSESVGRRVTALAALAPAVLVVAVQVWINRTFELDNDLLSPPDGRSLLTRIVPQATDHAPVLLRFLHETCVARPGLTQWLPLLALLLVVFAPRRLIGSAPTAALAFLIGAGGFVLVYLGTTREIEWHLTFSIERIVLQLLPVATLVVACAWSALSGRRGDEP